MRKYKAGLIAWSHEASNSLKIKGKFFSVGFVKVNRIKSVTDGYEVIISTKNYQNARKVLQLIAASLALLNKGAFFYYGHITEFNPITN